MWHELSVLNLWPRQKEIMILESLAQGTFFIHTAADVSTGKGMPLLRQVQESW